MQLVTKSVDCISEMSSKSPLPSIILLEELFQNTSEPAPFPDLSLGFDTAFKGLSHKQQQGTGFKGTEFEIRETWV